MVLAREKGARTEATLNEPGGILRVESAPENGETRLKEVEMVRKYYTEIVKKFSRFTQAEFDRQFQITYI